MGIENFSFLAKKLPSFKVHGSQVRIIHEPGQFYQELVTRAAASRERVVMSALYWGVEERERRLRDTIAASLAARPGLRVRVLLDWCRGTRVSRDGDSSASLLAGLHHHAAAAATSESEDRCRLAFYQTPQLRGWLARLLPAKWNEVVGLQHCKVYIFDNSLIVSGANLSQDYFTNRQDRYVLIEDCKELADYYEDLVDTISKFSFVVNKDGSFTESKSFQGLNFSKFVQNCSKVMQTFLSHHRAKNKIDLETADFDTVIFPTVQMGLYNVTQDCDITSEILRAGSQDSSYRFATGYFNLTDRFMKDIMETTKSQYRLLMAHPEANGFLGAKFPAGGIPHAYTSIAKMFFNQLSVADMAARVRMFEYRRPGWTFHGKGLWYTEQASSPGPCLTMVGSPNFGYRSQKRDLETQVVILTQNPDLQARLGEEQEQLYHHSEAVHQGTFGAEDRAVPRWVRFVVRVAREWF